MKKAILFLIIVLTFTSCLKSKGVSKIVVADWLLGEWKNNSADGNLSETWTKVNDSTFLGQSFFIKNKDTLHFETINLRQNGEELSYNALVKGQNNDVEVAFKLTSSTENQLIFENPKHDYPQKIVYNQITKGSVLIEISGIQQGKPSVGKYLMKRTKL